MGAGLGLGSRLHGTKCTALGSTKVIFGYLLILMLADDFQTFFIRIIDESVELSTKAWASLLEILNVFLGLSSYRKPRPNFLFKLR